MREKILAAVLLASGCGSPELAEAGHGATRAVLSCFDGAYVVEQYEDGWVEAECAADLPSARKSSASGTSVCVVEADGGASVTYRLPGKATAFVQEVGASTAVLRTSECKLVYPNDQAGQAGRAADGGIWR